MAKEYTVTEGEGKSHHGFNVFSYMVNIFFLVLGFFMLRIAVITDNTWLFITWYAMCWWYFCDLLADRQNFIKSCIVLLCRKYVNTKWLEY